MEHVPTQYSTTIHKVIKKNAKQQIFIANENSENDFMLSNAAVCLNK